MKENLWSIRQRIAEHNKSIPWNRKNLEVVLGKLNGNKSKDPCGISNIIFKQNIAGEDLKESLLILFNQMKL